MQYLRSKSFDLAFFLWTVILGLAIPYVFIRGEAAIARKLSRLWGRGILWGLKWIVRLEYEEIGLQNRPAGPVLYLCNHQSVWEAILTPTLIPDVAVVLKEELYRFPIVGWYLKYSPMIAIDRNGGMKSLKSMLRQAKHAVEQGRSVLIFPEGTRCDVDDRAPYQIGAAALYEHLNLPVVPMAVNAGVFWNDASMMKYDGKITVSYLPIIPPGLPGDEFLKIAFTKINDEKDRLVEGLDESTWINAIG